MIFLPCTEPWRAAYLVEDEDRVGFKRVAAWGVYSEPDIRERREFLTALVSAATSFGRHADVIQAAAICSAAARADRARYSRAGAPATHLRRPATLAEGDQLVRASDATDAWIARHGGYRGSPVFFGLVGPDESDDLYDETMRRYRAAHQSVRYMPTGVRS